MTDSGRDTAGFALAADLVWSLREVRQFLVDCPDCGARVLDLPLQGMRLDWPAVPRSSSRSAIWSLVKVGSTWFAGGGGAAFGDLAHELHEHQPASDERPRDFLEERLQEIDAHIAAGRRA